MGPPGTPNTRYKYKIIMGLGPELCVLLGSCKHFNKYPSFAKVLKLF
jgi:hypothetical protein